MKGAFEARPICQHSLSAAVAVLRLEIPDASLKSCRSLCQRDRNGRPRQGALIGLFDQRDYVHAVFRMLVEPTLPEGLRMKAYDLILSDTIALSLMSAMVDALEAYAASLGCSHLTISAPHGRGPLSEPLPDILESRGFGRRGLIMARTL